MLEKAIVLIAERVGTVTDSSPIYRTEPWGFESVNWFYNQAIRCKTTLPPEEVLNVILNIETELGRTRNAESTYESRIIDIDILYFDNEIISTENLQIPHKHIQDRRFVLMPLCDIAPDFVHPVLKKTSLELLFFCADNCVFT
jgi:2-amino-4-hydroxy-6-hydroxymethyldihydropteridine diphosphokinase